MHKYLPAKTFASAPDWAACRALLRTGSRTFHAASRVLPPRVRQAATGLYAFCRVADDAIDHGAGPQAALAELHGRLERLYAGRPDDIAADRAFADVVLGYAIPKEFPLALLEGFAWDATDRRYETLAELNAYAVRVAGVVGAMMALIMGVTEGRWVARACDLGVAMQLTNIARDVGEDARNGRVYLPLEWLREAGLDPPRWVASPRFDAALAGVIGRLLVEADALYERSELGLAQLPAACRPAMYAARLLYAEIGHELRRRDLDSVNHRAVVAWPRKARLLAGAMAAAARGTSSTGDRDVLPQAAFLLTSLRPDAAITRDRKRRLDFGDRVIGVVDLFERLERRDQSARVLY